MHRCPRIPHDGWRATGAAPGPVTGSVGWRRGDAGVPHDFVVAAAFGAAATARAGDRTALNTSFGVLVALGTLTNSTATPAATAGTTIAGRQPVMRRPWRIGCSIQK